MKGDSENWVEVGMSAVIELELEILNKLSSQSGCAKNLLEHECFDCARRPLDWQNLAQVGILRPRLRHSCR